MKNILLSFPLLLSISFTLHAHPVSEGHPVEKIVVAAAEAADNSTQPSFTGPSETKGIASIDVMGVIELGNEFASMQGKQMRARVFTIEPGGVVALHPHNKRPGYAYILEGTIVEHRNDTAEPIVHQANGIAIERQGVSHWWENVSDQPVKALVVDIFTPEAK